MIKSSNKLYEERQIWERAQNKIAVLKDFRRVWPPKEVVLKEAAGTTVFIWNRRIALSPIVALDRNLRIELEVSPLGSPAPEVAEQPTPVPDFVRLLATVTTLGGEPVENLSLTVLIGDTPVVSGYTNNKGCIRSDRKPPIRGESLFSQALTVEVQDESGEAEQYSP